MIKTHQKSTIQTVVGTVAANNVPGIILQIEATGNMNNKSHIYLIETVAKGDLDLSTLQSRLKAVENQLENTINTAVSSAEAAEAQIMTLEESLKESRDAREGLRESIGAIRTENKALYAALVECRRIFGSLPMEIETMIAKGE